MGAKELLIGGRPGRSPAKARRRPSAENGFSLIELLVVILIIGLLAAIAIPLFTSQTAKATDAQAKELARSAETTAESIATEHDGHYGQVSLEEISNTESTISIAPSKSGAYLSAATSGEDEFSVTAKATDGDELTITRDTSGAITRTCLSPVTKKGCSEGEKGSW